MNHMAVEAAYTLLLSILRQRDPNIDNLPIGMRSTPSRIVKALTEMTSGYDLDPRLILATMFDSEGYDEIISLKNIHFYSLCEHHILPFYGTVGIAYIPSKEKVVGLSKLARLVDCFSKRFQIQERMTTEIADALENYLTPDGVAVVVQGRHSCMEARGIGKEGATMTTSIMRGAFRDRPEARAEVLRLLQP